MNTQGWIKVSRSTLNWEWHDNPVMVSVWLHLLLMANLSESSWHGDTIERGQVVLSLHGFADLCGISVKQLRTAFERLEKSSQIMRKGSNSYTLVTICNFDKYQSEKNGEGQTDGKQKANEGQTDGKQKANEGQHNENINKLINQEEKNNVVTDAGAHTCEADFSEIENTATANFRLVCVERGWDEEDYLSAVKVFRLTCEADKKTHESTSDLVNHFRNWCNGHYKYGEKPLKCENEKPTAVQKNCFDEIFAEFYCEKFGTEYIFRKSDQKAISSLLEKIVLKMQEQNAEINLTEKQNALRAFLLKSYDKADKWLKENFTPSILDKKFNEIYGKLKSNTTAAGNSLSYIERIASELTGIQP